ncbi:hypothetical protein BDV30DRAFT_189833 [Aspergillus minisclerotigenes]|uniref:Secreted peptide n=1 Tax=Aspergillus minisclerotigenes TaxID=656917 RepID=A0A5N6IVM4_9EURO|nr:hypothetical protein BDV30DRAFT_189833 [Aspergillus minisclerotigenes]
MCREPLGGLFFFLIHSVTCCLAPGNYRRFGNGGFHRDSWLSDSFCTTVSGDYLSCLSAFLLICITNSLLVYGRHEGW